MTTSYMIAEAIFTVFVVFIFALPFAIIDTLIAYAFVSFLEWRENRRRR